MCVFLVVTELAIIVAASTALKSAASLAVVIVEVA